MNTVPELSIVIPTHNRCQELRTLLESLAHQTQSPGAFEAIVVVDGSTDETEAMLTQLELPFRLRVFRQEQKGVEVARNRGISMAQGRILLFLDDDTVAYPNLVAEHLRAQHDRDGLVVIGRLSNLLGRRPPRWASYRALDREDTFDRLANGLTPTFIDCHGGNLSLPRELCLAVGGFNTDLRAPFLSFGFRGNDFEFAFRLHEYGARFVYAHDALAVEDDRETLRDVLVDAALRGASSIVLWNHHPRLLPYLTIGRWDHASWKSYTARSVLLRLRIPPIVLGWPVRVIPSERWGRKFFQFLLAYSYWTGVRRTAGSQMLARLRVSPIILAYHAVGRSKERPSRFVVPAAQFRRQMKLLRGLHYNVVKLEELVSHLRSNELLPKKTIAITFDDGYADNAELAVPALEEYGLPATIFLVSASGAQVRWDSTGELEGRRLLSLDEIKGLVGRVAFGAHSRTHPRLTRMTPDEARREIEGSKYDLEGALGVPVTVFAYPYGEHNEAVRHLVKQAGFEAACTVEAGRNAPSADLYALRRIEVHGTDSLARFLLTLWLGARMRMRGRRRRAT